MANIDIPVPKELQKVLLLPACADLKLPKPKPIKVQLPGGGKLSSFSDLSKGIPTDCAMTFSLLLQIGPFLGATECLVKVLKLIQTAVDVLKDATNPLKLVGAIPKIIDAAVPVVECAVAFTPAGIVPFIRDLLCLILKVLKCFLSQMKSILKVLEGTALQITIAETAGNTDALAALKCAQENAMTQAEHLTSSLEALSVVLDIAGDLMQLAQVDPIKLPAMGSEPDIESLKQFVVSVEGVVATVQAAADLLGGC